MLRKINMFKYYQIIKFLMTHDLKFLKKCWGSEFIRRDFKWHRLFKKLLKCQNKYLFWWRLANEMYQFGNKDLQRIAKRINNKLIFKYNCDIGLGAKIGIKMTIQHFIGIVISNKVIIGNNFTCLQNVTIGMGKSEEFNVILGNNVVIGANVCIIGGKINIGDNVTIGALSFIDKSIPSDCIAYSKSKGITIRSTKNS